MTHPTGDDLMALAEAWVAWASSHSIRATAECSRAKAAFAAAVERVNAELALRDKALEMATDYGNRADARIERQSQELAACQKALEKALYGDGIADGSCQSCHGTRRIYLAGGLGPAHGPIPCPTCWHIVPSKERLLAMRDAIAAALRHLTSTADEGAPLPHRPEPTAERVMAELAAMLADTRFLIGCIADSTEALDAMTLEETCQWAAIRTRYSTPDGGSKHG